MNKPTIEELEAQVKQLAAENFSVMASREVLAKNALETCNEIYCAGYRNTALHDGLLESTGDRNKYPNPIRTLVDEAKRSLETPATDAILASLRAEGVEMAAQSDQFSNWVQQGLRHFALCIRDGSAQLRSKSEVQS